jgi:predicted RNase H-like HicB family nuclease
MRFRKSAFRALNIDRVSLIRHDVRMKMQTYTAIIRKDEGWWIGWVEEISGVNSQGRTRSELVKNLRSALREALEMNREEALALAGDDYEETLLKA